MTFETQLQSIKSNLNKPVCVRSLGRFSVIIEGKPVDQKAWGRDKTLQLLQYLIINRQQTALHKEYIIDRLWENANNGESDFKVALHGINKVLEPQREKRQSKYIIRQGTAYQLNFDLICLDVMLFEELLQLAYTQLNINPQNAKLALKEALCWYEGQFLPNRLYDDWTSAERERIQLLALNAETALAELVLTDNPNESILLAQNTLRNDPTWEDAYRILMRAYLQKGNRPQAIRSYQNCTKVLMDEYGIKPLPETRNLYQKIINT